MLKPAKGSQRRLKAPPLMPKTMRREIAMRRITFLVYLVVNPSCVTANIEDKVMGGHASAHYARSNGQDFSYVSGSGEWRNPMVSLRCLIDSAREEKSRLETEIDSNAKRPLFVELCTNP